MKSDYKRTYLNIKDPEKFQAQINRIRRNEIRKIVREIEAMDDGPDRRFLIKSLPEGTKYHLKENA